MSEWYSDIEAKVFNIVKTRTSNEISGIYWTSVSKTITESDFPCVYIYLVDSYETGEDISHDEVHAVRATFQIEVYSNKSKNEARKIIDEICAQFKALRFSISTIPNFSADGNVHIGKARCRRIIGAGDDIML